MMTTRRHLMMDLPQQPHRLRKDANRDQDVEKFTKDEGCDPQAE